MIVIGNETSSVKMLLFAFFRKKNIYKEIRAAHATNTRNVNIIKFERQIQCHNDCDILIREILNIL